MRKQTRSRFAPRWLVLVCLLLAAVVALLWQQRRVSSAASTALDITLSAPAGSYKEDLTLELHTPNEQAAIYYTLDGSAPDPATSASYENPLPLSASDPAVVVLRAQAFLPDGSAGPEASASYFMGLETRLPILSIIADPADLWDEARGIYTNHEARGREWERPVWLTYVDEQGGQHFQAPAGLRVHGGWTRFFYDKKSLRLYFRDAYGLRKLESPLFGEEGQTAFDHLYLNNSDMDLLLFRNLLTERLFRQMGGFAVRSRPLLLFINGQPWGIYTLRERIDERLLRENYGVPSAAISDTPNNRGQQPPELLAGDLQHWENFMQFVAENDLADPGSYEVVQTQIDVRGFIDYYLLQMYIANTDWPQHNVHQFRPRTPGGRWEWIVWDNNLAFDRLDRQMVDHVLAVEHPLGERMELLLNKLLANPDFYNLFLTRAADLLNTTLSADNVSAEVSRAAEELNADIAVEQARWNGPTDWQAVVQEMHTFAGGRSAIMREHFVESFGLPGSTLITIAQDGGPPGWVAVNDLPPQPLPWQGEQFVGTTIRLRAVPPSGYTFDRWLGTSGSDDPTSPQLTLTVGENTALSARFLPLDAQSPMPGDVLITAVQVDDRGDVEGDWLELTVARPGGVDLRGWRLSDNDNLEAVDEGSLIFADDALFADLAEGDRVRIITTRSAANDARFTEDTRQNGQLTIYAGNDRLLAGDDRWFNLGPRDNLALLAPGSAAGYADDIPVALWSSTDAVGPADFGLPPR